jgi:hypothetical protein
MDEGSRNMQQSDYRQLWVPHWIEDYLFFIYAPGNTSFDCYFFLGFPLNTYN